jgi:lysosomal acid phosphatase
MHVMSSDVDRVVMSAQANLAGFYPPFGADVWNSNLMWQPIPIHTVPREIDNMLVTDKPCPVYNLEMAKLLQSDEFMKMAQRNQQFYSYLEEMTGSSVTGFEDVSYIYDTLMLEEAYNFSLPEWARGVYPEKLLPLSDFYFAMAAYNRPLARLKSGPLLRDILTRFEDKALGKLQQNYWVYSAHDTTIANMLNTLGVFKEIGYHQPSFAAALMFELRQSGKDFTVQVYYKNGTNDAKALDIPGCGTICQLNDLMVLFHDLMPSNWDEECQEPPLVWKPIEKCGREIEKTLGTLGVAAAGCILGLIVIALSVLVARRVVNKRNGYKETL